MTSLLYFLHLLSCETTVASAYRVILSEAKDLTLAVGYFTPLGSCSKPGLEQTNSVVRNSHPYHALIASLPYRETI
jgi:hypothetical protein